MPPPPGDGSAAAVLRREGPGAVGVAVYCAAVLAFGLGHAVPLHSRPLPGTWVPHNATAWQWVPQPSVALPRLDDTVPTFPGLLLFCALPPVAASALAAAGGYGAADFAALWKAYGVALATAVALCNSVKSYAGRLRPCFYPICDAELLRLAAAMPPAPPVCRATGHEAEDARKSFFSGHSCYAMGAAVVCALYLQAKARRGWRGRLPSALGPLPLRAAWEWAAVAPLVLTAVFIAASRVHDNRHHVGDVVGGAVAGAGLGCWGYLMFFPPPWATGAAADAPLQLQQDEELSCRQPLVSQNSLTAQLLVEQGGEDEQGVRTSTDKQ